MPRPPARDTVAEPPPGPPRSPRATYESDLGDAFAAMRAGDFEAARHGFAALAEAEPTPPGEVLEGLAVSLFVLNARAEACAAMERAYRTFIAEATPCRAVSAAAFLVSTRYTMGDRAAARGWEHRGLRLVEQIGPCVEHGYLLLANTGCDVHDTGELSDRAERARRLAQQFGDHELELRAMGDLGLALVSRGQVDRGFALLDETMVAITAGEITDRTTRGKTFCAMLSACERTGDIGRAEDWCSAIEASLLQKNESAIIQVHCDLVRGAVDALRGRWDDAEARLLAAVRSPAAPAHHRGDSIGRLAELRIQQGRYEEAEVLLTGFDDNFEALPALARLRLVQGDHQRAASLLRSIARGLGEDYMRLAPVLALSIEVELHRGNRAAATRAAARLFALEEVCESNEIRALARLGRARVALHGADHVTAIEELETALSLLTHTHRPVLAAQVRLELARALATSGDAATARSEAETALAAFERLGIAPEVAAGQAVIAVLDDAAGVADRGTRGSASDVDHAPSGASLTKREREVATLVSQGLTNREVADQLFLSVRTVETHVDRVLGKLDFHTRTRLAGWAERERAGEVT